MPYQLSDTQVRVLTVGSQHPKLLTLAPKHLPAAACRAVVNSLLKNRLLVEVPAPPPPRSLDYQALIWRYEARNASRCPVTGEIESTRIPYMLQVTDEGLRAIGLDPNEGDAEPGEPDCSGIEGSVPAGTNLVVIDPLTKLDPPEAPALPVLKVTAVSDTTLTVERQTLRFAAARVIDAWDVTSLMHSQASHSLTQAIEAMREALNQPTTRAPRAPRAGSKQDEVLAMLRRPEGATVAQIAEATGWQQHTVRGFLAGLKKRQGITVEVAERVRMVGPNKAGAKGSYTVYRVAAQEAGQ